MRGYLKLTDFGVARLWDPKKENCHETSGTPGYMAPEVMCKNNHGLVSDIFAIGVIVWEIMKRKRPYRGVDRKAIRDAILEKPVRL
jgi:serine/threonine protein kinase